MPTYEYRCEECGIVFERFQRFSEEPVKICPECDGPVRRVIHPVGIIFKGSGFYVTDNKGDTSSLTPKSEVGDNTPVVNAKSDKAEKSDTATKDTATSTEKAPAAKEQG